MEFLKKHGKMKMKIRERDSFSFKSRNVIVEFGL